MIHIVSQGETVNSIASQYDISPSRLMYDNQISPGQILVVGQALAILIPTQVHFVKPNDTLYSIAKMHGITVNELIRNNPFLANSFLQSGEYIVISYESDRDRRIASNGYAYPYISENTLREVLPYMSEISPFSYGFTEDGTLINMDDEFILNNARRFGVRPMLVLTPHSTLNAFNNRLINSLVNNPSAQDRLIYQLIAKMQEKGYTGVDMDFEYILPENRDLYTSFVAKLAEAMHRYGYRVTVALAPKTSADQKGLLYEGIDYGGLGSVADSVLLMTYEWGYKYGPPMAIAPIPNVRRVVEYALSEIPAEKVDLGIPNYAYDWPLPFEKGVTSAETIGYIQAIDLASRYNAIIQYDSYAEAPFFEYQSNGINHIVWFEDVRSIGAKLNLIKQYSLRGCGYWNIMRPFRSNYLILNNNFYLD